LQRIQKKNLCETIYFESTKILGTQGGINVIDAGLYQMIERDGRKADLVYKGMGRGKQDLAFDISIGDSSAQSYLHNSAHISKYVLNLLATNKITKYAADYRNAGIDFMPLTFEMLGETSDIFTNFFKTCCV
jgi:hypothetical protein